jgi:hypothetical protein
MCGSMPIDVCREIECDMERLWLRSQNIMFNEARAEANLTKGLDVSPYFVNHTSAYWGTYLN